MGRPSNYNDDSAATICKHAYKLSLLGSTDKQMADFFEVSEQTLNAWKTAHPEFLESLNKGKDEADAKVAKSLYRRAMGYSHKAEKIFNNQGVILRAEYVEHYPPDTTAMIFWLKNRQTAKWRDKTDHEHSGSVNFTNMTEEELDQRIAQRLAQQTAED